MFDLNMYKKEAKLKDGTKILLRPMVAEDQDALYTFFKSVPKEDARYLRDDVASRLIVEDKKSRLHQDTSHFSVKKWHHYCRCHFKSSSIRLEVALGYRTIVCAQRLSKSRLGAANDQRDC